MQHHDYDLSLRSFSREKHKKNEWRSRIPSLLLHLKPVVNYLSYKHAGVSRLASCCKDHYKVIEIGSGNGTFSHYFSLQCKCTIVAVDWSPEALKRLRTLKIKKIYAVCADAHNLPFKNNTFNAGFTVDTFGHLKDQLSAISETHRILCEGAPFFFHSECSDYLSRWPDKKLVERNNCDIPACNDGHISLKTSTQLINMCTRMFTCVEWFSPAGLLGWIIGYPEKYVKAFETADFKVFLAITRIMKEVKRSIIGRSVLRIVNAVSNHIERKLGVNGGGSVFADLIKPVQSRQPNCSIDIIIPTLNRERELYQLTEKLITQCKFDDRILIVSQDSVPPDLPESSWIHVIFSYPANLPLARNRGIYASSNEIILFLDDDVEPENDLLDKHRQIYKDSSINCVAGFVNDNRFVTDTKRPSSFDIRTSKCIQNFSYTNPCLTISFMGAHFSIRRSSIAGLIKFDTLFKGNAYWEDIDFAFRLLNKKFSIQFLPEAKVTHHYSKSGGCRNSSPEKYIYDYMANAAYFSMKYAPVKYYIQWCNYWKYRLEYETRSKSSFILKHDIGLVIAGVSGYIAGIVRFTCKGKRIGLPKQVVESMAVISDKE